MPDTTESGKDIETLPGNEIPESIFDYFASLFYDWTEKPRKLETVKPVTTFVNPPSINVPVQLGEPGQTFENLIIIGIKSSRTNNVTPVYLGSAVSQEIAIIPGAVATIDAPIGKKFNLIDWYISIGTGGDGVFILYV